MKRLVGIFTCALMLGFAASASAGPMDGSLTIQPQPCAGIGCGSVGVRITDDDIDWYLPIAGGFGEMFLSEGSGYFAPIVNATGEIKDLNAAAQPAGPPMPVPLADFMKFDVVGGFPQTNSVFTLTQILPCSALPGFVCAAGPGAPFGFRIVNGLVTVTMAMRGFVENPVQFPGLQQDWRGTWNSTTQYTSFEQLFSELDKNKEIFAGYDGTVITIPEPATLLMLGGGLLGLGAWRRRSA